MVTAATWPCSGHRGRLSFTGISQPWLAQAAKAWAGEQLPRHRGAGASNVRIKVNALARLSESLRIRDDDGLSPDRLGRLCANLDGLRPAEVKTAIQIGIDTGRRPEEKLSLPLDCLQRDKGGEPVLVYDNAKADRLGHRLQVNEATAAVITAQQARVQGRFPDTPTGVLKLLPLTSPQTQGSQTNHHHDARGEEPAMGRHIERRQDWAATHDATAGAFCCVHLGKG